MATWTLTNSRWAILALMLGLYVVLCARTALYMARSGRSFWKWLILTLCLTSIPASLVVLRQQRKGRLALGRSRRYEEEEENEEDDEPQEEPAKSPVAAAIICGHCGRRIGPAEIDRAGGIATCPRCRLPLDEEKLA